MARLAFLVLVVLALTLSTPLVALAEDSPGETRLTEDGYCVLVTPAHPPYVFVDASRCDVP